MTEAEHALASFPLPHSGKTSQENYWAILNWLYNDTPLNVAAVIIELSMKERRKCSSPSPTVLVLNLILWYIVLRLALS